MSVDISKINLIINHKYFILFLKHIKNSLFSKKTENFREIFVKMMHFLKNNFFLSLKIP